MKKFLLILMLITMSFGFNSCASGQSISADYQKVYFDHVIYGQVISDDYVYDGTYSYHILSPVPYNVYWELYPVDWEIYLYTKQMVRMRAFTWERRAIFYNRHHHNYYAFDHRHPAPHTYYNYGHHRHYDAHGHNHHHDARPPYRPNTGGHYGGGNQGSHRPQTCQPHRPNTSGHTGGHVGNPHTGGQRTPSATTGRSFSGSSPRTAPQGSTSRGGGRR